MSRFVLNRVATLDVRRNADGVVARHPEKWHWDAETEEDTGACSFMWFEGNSSCDCNRSDFFDQGRGEDTDDRPDDDVPCSHGLFSVRLTDDSGKVLYCDGAAWV